MRSVLIPCVAAALAAAALSASAQDVRPPRPENAVPRHAAGTFQVQLTRQPTAEDSVIGRMTIDKQFLGDLEGTSRGEMLAAGTAVPGSAGYVAIERVTGTLHGRSGSFLLQHSGTMSRGTGELTIVVLPDSGTGELTGLTGRMNIIIADGRHSYELDYELPPS